MYKVILLDDEDSILLRLRKMMDSFKDDFEVVGAYKNGYDALENGLSLEPDVMITDIKMPYITGINVIREAKEELPLLETIILSGYDSFDYAKEAISLNVSSYLIKPLDFEELKEALYKIKANLDKQKELHDNISSLEEKALSSKSLLQSEDLQKLITIKEIPPTFLEKLKDDEIDLNYKYQMFAIFDSDKEDIPYDQLDLLHLSAKKIINEEFPAIPHYSFLYDEQFVVLLLANIPFNNSDFLRIMNSIIWKIKRGTSISVSCGLSECVSPLVNYRKIYRHAKRSLEYRTVMGKGLVLSFPDLEENENNTKEGKVDENEFKNITYLLSYGKKEDAFALIDKIIEEISLPSFKDRYYFILSSIMEAILKSSISLKELYQITDSQSALSSQLYSLKTKESVLNFFHNLASNVLEINKNKRIAGIETSFDRIKRFIDVNFTNPNLLIEDVAKELCFSVSYITTILKKHDTSFTKLLTDARMRMATSLLTTSADKIVTIAKKVGYNDPYYFSHCFKKYTEKSPDEFRKAKENS